MKRIPLFFVLAFLLINVGSVKLFPERLESISQVDISLVDSSLTQLHQGVYEFTATIQNTGDPATTGLVPISWEEYVYTLPLTNGIGTLDESAADYDINGDGDEDDTFAVEWNDTIRPWDAEIDGVYVYALADHSENRGFNRSYYIDGKSKLFKLGNKIHFLYYADNDVASFGLGDAVILHHPSPNFELVVYSNVSFTDIKINGVNAEVNHSVTGVETLADGTSYTYSICVVPNQAAIEINEQIEFSCTIIAHETKTCEVALLTNWSPDGNIRYRWVPFDQVDVSFEAINRPYFIHIDSTVTPIDACKKEFTATVKNIGTPATSGIVPISWEKVMYEFSLDNGVGTLEESAINHDLNGDGDNLDSFEVTRHINGGRQWDAIINNGVQDIHAYAICEGPTEDPWFNRTYYIDREPKLFQLGSETHSLYIANNEMVTFGLGNVFLLNHSSPTFQIITQLRYSSQYTKATDFKINGEVVETNYTHTLKEIYGGLEDLWYLTGYTVSDQAFEVDTGEEATISCTLASYDSFNLYLRMSWSPDGNIRYVYNFNGFFDQEISINQPDFSLIDDALTSSVPGVYQFTATVRNNGAQAITGTMSIDWGDLVYQLPLNDGVGTLNEGIVDLDLNGDGDKADTFGVTWFHNETHPWDAIVGGVHAYAIFEGPPDDIRLVETYYLRNGQPKLFQLGSETHSLQRAEDSYAIFSLNCPEIVTLPSPNFELYFNSTSLSASNFEINGVSVEADHTLITDEFYPAESWAGKKRWSSTINIVPINAAIDSDEIVTFSCIINVHETVTCDLALLMNWSPDGNARFFWVPFWEEDIQFKTPTIKTESTTTTSTFTTTTETEPTKSIGTPGFSFVFILMSVIPVLVYTHKRRKNT